MIASNAKTVLITGSSSGIGRATAVHAAERGHRVLATARDPAALTDIVAASRGAITPLALDVTDQGSVAACAERAFDLTEGTGPDVLVNNAGFSACGPIEIVPLENAKTCFDTNVLGLLAVTQAFLPAMRRRRAGRIVNVSSLVGRIKVPYEGVYGATKHAVEGLSEALRFEVAPFGIDVVVVQPGPLQTGFEERWKREFDKLPERGGEYREHMKGFLFHRARVMRKAPTGEAAAQVIVRAIEAERPPHRVLFPADAHFARLLFGAMPDRIMHAILRAAFGVPRTARPSAPAEDGRA
jgi:NAD(P)-dependent dehydrogenase (short-subunit alcohol dehydrogenase family)